MPETKNNFWLVLISIATFLAIDFVWLPAYARSLQPIKDPEIENEVIELYNRALKFSKGDRNVHARILLEKAARYDPTSVSPYIHSTLSEIYHDLGNPERAIHEALLSLKFEPGQKHLYYNIGLYCKDARRYKDGIRFLERYSTMVSGDKRVNALSLIDALKKEQEKLTMFSPTDVDYFTQLQAEDGVHQWSRSKIPLKVYIAPSSSARGFNRQFVQLARDAFITWYEASGKRLSFEFIDNIGLADINLEWTDNALKLNDDKYERMKAGLTTSQRGSDDKFIHARIQVRTVKPNSRDPEPIDKIKETCLHEIGHALGLNGHSSNPADIMYFGNTARQLPALTKRDRATIARLYSMYPPYPMIGVDTSFPYPPPETDIPRLGSGDGDEYNSTGSLQSAIGTTGGAVLQSTGGSTSGGDSGPFAVTPNVVDPDAAKTPQWTRSDNVATPGQSGWQMPRSGDGQSPQWQTTNQAAPPSSAQQWQTPPQAAQQWQTPPQAAQPWHTPPQAAQQWQTPPQAAQQWQTPPQAAQQWQTPPQAAQQWQAPPQAGQTQPTWQTPAQSAPTWQHAVPPTQSWSTPSPQSGWMPSNSVANPGQSGWQTPTNWNSGGAPPAFNSSGSSQPLQPWTPNQSPFNAFQGNQSQPYNQGQ